MATGSKRVIVLTGATRGLGRALVPRFAEAGCTVLGCGRSKEHVAALAQSFPPPHDFVSVDVSDATVVTVWADRMLQAYGPPDLLVNNAALMNTPAPLWGVPAAEFDAVIDVGVKGIANVIRAFVPAMVARKRGVIVNLSSGWGRVASAEVAPYNAAKFAVEGMTLALAQELPDGMAAVPLNPGVIDTDMLRQCYGESAGEYQSPDEWAKTAAPYILRLGPKDNGRSLSVPG
jgi:NAD(P)-dependent dehydrogenase (short-subunit alcohol dehydrogenase family)